MAIVTTDDKHYKAIAGMIRAMIGDSTEYSSGEMTNGIIKVYNKAHANGIEYGVEQGKKEAYDAFWDAYQDNGKRTNYYGAFAGHGWTDETFRPKYDICPRENTQVMFYATKITDLKQRLLDCRVRLDTSNCTILNNAFNSDSLTHIPYIDARSAKTYGVQDVFGGVSIVTIDGLYVLNTTKFSNPFGSGKLPLTNLTIDGVIGQNGFKCNNCEKLTHESLMSIINALETKTSGTWTVTLGTVNLAKLTDTEKKIATDKGWTLA